MAAGSTARSGRWAGAGVVIAFLTALTLALAPPVATAAPHLAYLDVAEDNSAGEFAGGFASQLPTDQHVLREALDSARAAGVAPERYGALVRQYWLAVAADNAGIVLDEWEPAHGLAANLGNVDNVYINYLRLATDSEANYWAGMAGLAGLSFAAGFWDLHDIGGLLSVPGVHALGNAVGDAMTGLPWPLIEDMPRDVRLLATVGPTLTQADIDWYLHRLLIKQRNIFMDMVPMHEAYAAEGLDGIEEMARSGAYDDYFIEAWRLLDSGDPANGAEALMRMASREQNQIINEQWDETAAGRGDVGRVLTYVTTVGGSPDVPGASTLGEFRSLSVHTRHGDERLVVHTPLPAYNWADRQPRWDYLEQDLVPAYRALVQDRPAEATHHLGVEFRPEAEKSRILARLPDFVAEMTNGWEVAPA